MVEVKGSTEVDVSINRLHGKLAINLVNTSGAHWDTQKPLIDSIEPIGPLEIAIRSRGQAGENHVAARRSTAGLRIPGWRGTADRAASGNSQHRRG